MLQFLRPRRGVRGAYLGAYGFGNVGDELCALEAIQAFPADELHLSSVVHDHTRRMVPQAHGCFTQRKVFRRLRPDFVVFGGGGIGDPKNLKRIMPWFRDARAMGATIHIHNIGVSADPPDEWLDAEAADLLSVVASFSVRDEKSAECVAAWNLGLSPRITRFPERLIAPDYALADALLPTDRPLLGISIINSAEMTACLEQNHARIEALLAPYRGCAVVPIVSHWHYKPEGHSDAAGFDGFRARFLDGWDLTLPEMLDRAWWLRELTPPRLKGIIARLGLLISQRKHNIVHAVGAGTPCIGLHPAADDSLARTFASLSDHMPQGSYQLPLKSEEASA